PDIRADRDVVTRVDGRAVCRCRDGHGRPLRWWWRRAAEMNRPIWRRAGVAGSVVRGDAEGAIARANPERPRVLAPRLRAGDTRDAAIAGNVDVVVVPVQDHTGDADVVG